jgi:hypothetical protein
MDVVWIVTEHGPGDHMKIKRVWLDELPALRQAAGGTTLMVTRHEVMRDGDDDDAGPVFP